MTHSELLGKKVIVTGANNGLGFVTAKELAGAGAHVTLAVRNEEKGERAVQAIQSLCPHAVVEAKKLDLADLESVRQFSAQWVKENESLDLLINNAGMMMPPFGQTKQGFELQFGCNHLGHFALTGLLLPLLKVTPKSRVVTVSSLAHRGASITFNNLTGVHGYYPYPFYAQSKLANLLFAKSLDDKLKKAGLETKSIACHPGIASTNLFAFGKPKTPWYTKSVLALLSQPAEKGALCTLYAATHPFLEGGEYIGPRGLGNRTGLPSLEVPKAGVYDLATMDELWSVSEQATGVTYDFSPPLFS